MKTFGERVKTRREELGMTQDELAKRLGYKSRSSINKIELDQRNMKQSQIADLAKALNTTPGYLMGWKDGSLPSNVSVPAAHAIPILGTICCGNGIDDKSFDGYFFVDHSIRADYCLHVVGDSMEDAHIYNGDIAFIRQEYEFEDGKIYGIVVDLQQGDAVLKKVYKSNGNLILQPCNDKYSPIVCRPEDCYIIGRLCGVYHKEI